MNESTSVVVHLCTVVPSFLPRIAEALFMDYYLGKVPQISSWARPSQDHSIFTCMDSCKDFVVPKLWLVIVSLG